MVMTKAKVIGVIPARYQSSRFPGKVLADILGKSLIRRTYENMLKCELLEELVIATDDMRVVNHAESFGAKAVMTLASHESGTDRAAQAIRDHFPHAEIVVNIQADEPCLHPKVVDTLICDMIANREAVMTTPVVKITDFEQITNPSIPKCVFDVNHKALYFSRQPIPYPCKIEHPDYYRHMGVYCFRSHFLQTYATLPYSRLRATEDLEQLKVLDHGYPIHISIVEYDGVEVNHPDDIRKVEEFLCRENTSLSLEELSPLSARG